MFKLIKEKPAVSKKIGKTGSIRGKIFKDELKKLINLKQKLPLYFFT
jgi:hypothetical protein